MAQSNLSAINGCMVSFTTIFSTSAEAAREIRSKANMIATLEIAIFENRLRITFYLKDAEMLLCLRLPMRCRASAQAPPHSQDLAPEHVQHFGRLKPICFPPGPAGPSPGTRQRSAVILKTCGPHYARP